jgi:hypothetical protein
MRRLSAKGSPLGFPSRGAQGFDPGATETARRAVGSLPMRGVPDRSPRRGVLNLGPWSTLTRRFWELRP